MSSFEVIGIASALATAASIRFEWAVPRIVNFDICHHILGLIVSPETVAAIFLSKWRIM
jgi:hypothetical protein